MKMLSGLNSTVNSLTSVVISLLGLGIVVSLLGGNVPFVGGIADNIIGLVQLWGCGYSWFSSGYNHPRII